MDATVPPIQFLTLALYKFIYLFTYLLQSYSVVLKFSQLKFLVTAGIGTAALPVAQSTVLNNWTCRKCRKCTNT